MELKDWAKMEPSAIRSLLYIVWTLRELRIRSDGILAEADARGDKASGSATADRPCLPAGRSPEAVAVLFIFPIRES